MEPMKVDFTALSSGASDIKANFQALDGALTDLEQRLQPMLTSWSGEAREAYAAQKQRWDESAQGMAQVLMRMGQLVEESHDAYRQQENVNRNRFS